MTYAPPKVRIFDQHVVWYPEGSKDFAWPAKVREIIGDNGSILRLWVQFDYGWQVMNEPCRHIADPMRNELPAQAMRSEGAWGLLSEYQDMKEQQEAVRLAGVRAAEEAAFTAELTALPQREKIEAWLEKQIIENANAPEPYLVAQVIREWGSGVTRFAQQIVYDMLHKPAKSKPEVKKKELAKAG